MCYINKPCKNSLDFYEITRDEESTSNNQHSSHIICIFDFLKLEKKNK